MLWKAHNHQTSFFVWYWDPNSSISFPGFKDIARKKSCASGGSVTRNNTEMTRRDVPRDVVSHGVWCGLHNAIRSCSIPNWKIEETTGTVAPETARSKRASLQTPSLTYLTSLDCKQRSAGTFTNSPATDGFLETVAFCPFRTPCTLFFLVSSTFWFILFPSPPFFSTSGSTFSQAVCATRRERLSTADGCAADLLRVCKLELKELSTSENPWEIYRPACFHE